jgi:hypothetical protein
MAKFAAGDDPADHTVREVVDYLKGDDATPDEYERVMEAERQGGGRLGIINLTGTEPVSDPAPDVADEAMTKPDGSEAAGPNEAATGQESPADQAKTSSDPQASGDAGLTADQYRDDAPAALGPDMPQSQAEAEAHAQTLATQAAATPTPEEALKLAGELAQRWKTPRPADANQ